MNLSAILVQMTCDKLPVKNDLHDMLAQKDLFKMGESKLHFQNFLYTLVNSSSLVKFCHNWPTSATWLACLPTHHLGPCPTPHDSSSSRTRPSVDWSTFSCRRRLQHRWSRRKTTRHCLASMTRNLRTSTASFCRCDSDVDRSFFRDAPGEKWTDSWLDFLFRPPEIFLEHYSLYFHH